MARGFGIPVYDPPLSRRDVEEGGQVLFRNFVREEFQHEGLPVPVQAETFDEGGDSAGADVSAAQASFLEEESDGNANSLHFRPANRTQYRSAESLGIGTPDGYKNDVWSQYGRDLRKLADDFSKSSQGEEVRNRVRRVDLKSINQQRFFELLYELFTDGLSTERVLALFCFCSNLLIRAARENGMDLTKYLFTWSLEYIRSKVCDWVYEHGGWGKVLNNMYTVIQKILFCGALIVVIVAGVVYIRKNL